MASYQLKRGRFIEAMQREGLSYAIVLALLRDGQAIQTCSERGCSNESADRDRVPCPKESQQPSNNGDGASCLCRDHGSYQGEGESDDGEQHGRIPRVSVRSWRAERRIEQRLPAGFQAVFNGDPRGACVKIKVPSGRTDDWGQTGICVPTRD